MWNSRQNRPAAWWVVPAGSQKLLGEKFYSLFGRGRSNEGWRGGFQEKLTSRHEVRFVHLGVMVDFLCLWSLLGGRVVFCCMNIGPNLHNCSEKELDARIRMTPQFPHLSIEVVAAQ